jgi:phosphatidylethanolamine-binding protein (PEBP) family uncharacterized protein
MPRLEISSSAFAQGQPIPRKYTGDGVSPPLAVMQGHNFAEGELIGTNER